MAGADRNVDEAVVSLRFDRLSHGYIVGPKLGAGNFGVVREVVSRTTGQALACKIIPKPHADAKSPASSQPSADVHLQLLRREVAIAQDLSKHVEQGVVRLVDAFEDDKRLYMVMELCQGGSLADYVENRRHEWKQQQQQNQQQRRKQKQTQRAHEDDKIATEEALRWKRRELAEVEAGWVVAQLASTLAQCHAEGVLHRDVKPENVLLSRPVLPGRFASGLPLPGEDEEDNAATASTPAAARSGGNGKVKQRWAAVIRGALHSLLQGPTRITPAAGNSFHGTDSREGVGSGSEQREHDDKQQQAEQQQQSRKPAYQAVKLADFGLAERLDGDRAHVANPLAGSPAYVAPEVAQGRADAIGFASDMWGLGVVLFFMLTDGRLPFSGRDTRMLLRNVRRGAIDFTSLALVGVSAPAKEVLKKLLAVEPSDRPTAAEVVKMEWVVQQQRRWREMMGESG